MTSRTSGFLVSFATALGVAACFDDNPAAYEAVEMVKAGQGADDDAIESDADDDLASGDDGALDEDVDDDATGDDAAGGAASGGADDDVTQSGADDDAADDDDGADDGADADAAVMVVPMPSSTVDPSSPFYPPCSLGLATNGEEIKKGTQCTPEDVQLCYRECGPVQIGWKTETCLAGVYAEGDCAFPEENDYSCFAIPEQIDTATCPSDLPPQSTKECDVPECTLCNLNGQYFDTNNNAKEGYCICREPDAQGIRTWSCASSTAWPCPFSRGC